MLPRLAGFLFVALTGCTSNAISFLQEGSSGPSCADDFGDAGSECPPSACPFVGSWQNLAIDGQPCGEGAIALDATGAVRQLTSSGWEPAGHFASCGNRARGRVFQDLLKARVLPSNCGPACEVSISRADSGTCFLQADVPCSPTSSNNGALAVTLYVYSCVR